MNVELLIFVETGRRLQSPTPSPSAWETRKGLRRNLPLRGEINFQGNGAIQKWRVGRCGSGELPRRAMQVHCRAWWKCYNGQGMPARRMLILRHGLNRPRGLVYHRHPEDQIEVW